MSITRTGFIAFSLLAGPSAFAATSATYDCRADSIDNKITIETNQDRYGDNTEYNFMLTVEGLFLAYDATEESVHQCGYKKESTTVTYPRGDGIAHFTRNKEEMIETGVHCTTLTSAAGYEFTSVFSIQSLGQDIRKNPSSFSATITPDDRREDKILMLCRKRS